MQQTTVLQAGRLAWLEKCERRLWLDRYGEPDERAILLPQARQRMQQGQAHETTIIEAMRGPATPLPTVSWTEAVQMTHDLMVAGAPEIRQAALEGLLSSTLRLRGKLDILVRVEQPSTLGAWSYEPIEVKSHRQATPSDRLQLDAYRWLLQILQGVTPRGILWLGATMGQPLQEVYEDTLDEFESALDDIAALLLRPTAPPIRFRDPCGYCPWRAHCEREAITQQDLALLTGLDIRAERALRNMGIATLTDLVALSERDFRGFPYVGKSTAIRLQYQARAILAGQPIIRNDRPRTALPAIDLWFDLETDERTQEPWAFGWSTDAETTDIVLVASQHTTPLLVDSRIRVQFVRDAAAGWACLANAAAQGNILHWGTHEQTLVRQAPAAVRTTLSHRLVNALPLVAERVVLPIIRTPRQSSGQLKAIGAVLGFTWPEQAGDWMAARTAFDTWQATGDTDALVLACQYLCADVLALAHIWRWLALVMKP